MMRSKRDAEQEMEIALDVYLQWKEKDELEGYHLFDQETGVWYTESVEKVQVDHPEPGPVTVRKADGSVVTRPMNAEERALWAKIESEE